MNVYAHSKPGSDQSEWQTLEAHAAAVASIAGSFARRVQRGADIQD